MCVIWKMPPEFLGLSPNFCVFTEARFDATMRSRRAISSSAAELADEFAGSASPRARRLAAMYVDRSPSIGGAGGGVGVGGVISRGCGGGGTGRVDDGGMSAMTGGAGSVRRGLGGGVRSAGDGFADCASAMFAAAVDSGDAFSGLASYTVIRVAASLGSSASRASRCIRGSHSQSAVT